MLQEDFMISTDKLNIPKQFERLNNLNQTVEMAVYSWSLLQNNMKTKALSNLRENVKNWTVEGIEIKCSLAPAG